MTFKTLSAIIALMLYLCACSFPATCQNSAGGIELALQYSSCQNAQDLSFAAKAHLLAVSCGDGKIDLWNTATWALERTITYADDLNMRNYNTKALALSPDGTSFALFGKDGEVQIWSTSSGKLLKKLAEPVGLPVSVVWSADGKRIAAGSTETVRIWSYDSGKVIRTFPATGDVAFSVDGKTLATAGENNAFLFDIASGRKIRTFTDKAGVSGPIALSPDGRYVATGGEDPNWNPGPLPKDEEGNEYAPTESFYSHQLKVKLWDRRTGKRLRLLPGHNNLGGGTTTLQFTPESRALFSGGSGYAALWSVRDGHKISSFNNGYSSALSPDGKLIAVTWDRVRVYSVATKRNLLCLHSPPSSIISVAFSRDGEVLAAGDQSGESTSLRLWDIKRGRLARGLQGPPPDLHDVGFLTGNRVFSNSTNGTCLWDATSYKLLKTNRDPKETNFHGYQQYGSSIGDAAFSSDSRYFAVRTNARPKAPAIEIWNVETGKQLSEIKDIGDGAALLFFSPDGQSLAASLPSPVRMPEGKLLTDNKVAVWDTKTGQLKQELILGKEPARTMAYSPDGRTLAAAIGAAIYFYDAETLKESKKLINGQSQITALAFSPDGSRIASGHVDGTIRLWDTQSNKLLLTMLGFPSADGKNITQDWLAYTPDGRYDWSPGAASLIRWRYNGKLYMPDVFKNELQRRYLLK